jgi:hypothetical protein
MMEQAFNLFGNDLLGDPIRQDGGPLSRRFTLPPFSILDARSGAWQERKARWLSYGLRGELGRDARAFGDISHRQARNFLPGGGGPRSVMRMAGAGEAEGQHQASIFDPLLVELPATWFCKPGGMIVDPFAGGSTRGVVASLLGFQYWGVDLRPEQIEANREQAAAICKDTMPAWIVGDALDVLPDAPMADMVLTCPPYHNLEVYSDDPRDLSAMPYDKFLDAYKKIIRLCAQKLKPNCYAVFVVSDFRDQKSGALRGFPAATVQAFTDAGMELYNEMVLVQPVASLAVRVTAQFQKSKKIGRCHQSVLVFRKGADQ